MPKYNPFESTKERPLLLQREPPKTRRKTPEIPQQQSRLESRAPGPPQKLQTGEASTTASAGWTHAVGVSIAGNFPAGVGAEKLPPRRVLDGLMLLE